MTSSIPPSRTSALSHSSGPAISVQNISKVYKLGAINRRTLVDEIQYGWLKWRGKDPVAHMGTVGAKSNQRNPDFWALKDVSFDVEPGEIVGLIGRNGSGKSTLLKILSRITEPTAGSALIAGRVGSLLEVGTGFHPELTGRENVYMNGTILGMKRREIEAKFDEIVEFSELEQFIDTPVKRYSSGMYVRLAFAVAAHLQPEILFIDEVLAVGDVAFQKKCLGKMEDVANGGRTIVFVSHNMHAISTLCQKAVWLDGGRVHAIGPAREIVSTYTAESMLRTGLGVQAALLDKSPAIIEGVKVLDGKGMESDVMDAGESMEIEIQVAQRDMANPVRIVLRIHSAEEDALALCTTTFHDFSLEPCLAAGHQIVRCHIPGNLFNVGTYWISVGIDRPQEPVFSEWSYCKSFHRTKDSGACKGTYVRLDGVLSPFQRWSLFQYKPFCEEEKP